jgi:hypothetical protein
MRLVNLAKLAARAELLQVEQLAKRQGRRAGFGVGAAIFAIATLTSGELAAGEALMRYVSTLSATLIVFGVNVVLTAVLTVMAMRSSPSQGERDAIEIRNKAIGQMQTALTFAALLPAARTAFGFWRNRRQSRRRIERSRK